MLLLTFIGPEDRGRSMRIMDDEDMAEVKGQHHLSLEVYPIEIDAPVTNDSKRATASEARIEVA